MNGTRLNTIQAIWSRSKGEIADEALATKVAEQVHDNARVAAGLLDDPRPMLKRLNELLEQVLAAKP